MCLSGDQLLMYMYIKTLHPGPVSQRAYELMTQISQKKLCHNFHWNHLIRSKLCTCCDSIAVMTCAEFWPDWITILHKKPHILLQDLDHDLNNICEMGWGLINNDMKTVLKHRPQTNGIFPGCCFHVFMLMFAFMSENVWHYYIFMQFANTFHRKIISHVRDVVQWHCLEQIILRA